MTKDITPGITVIIKYANRKHYNTSTSKYVTLAEVLALGVDNFMVVDNVTKRDITREVLLNALTSHFRQYPTEFDMVKPLIVETLGLGAPVLTDVLPTGN